MSLLDVLPELRAFSENNMPDSAQIYTPGAYTQDEGGGRIESAPTSVTVPCRLSPVTDPAEQEVAMRLQQVGLEVLTVPLETAVSVTGSVRHTSARDGAVADLTAVAVVPPGSFAVHKRVLVRRI